MARTCGSPMRPGFWCVRSRRPSTVIWASQVHRTAGPFSGKVPGAGHRRVIGAPGEIRTPDPQIRSLVLYPAELRALACRVPWPGRNGRIAIGSFPPWQARISRGASGSDPLAAPRAEFDCAIGDDDAERGADRAVDQPNLATMGADQLGRDRKPEPGAAAAGRPLERLEQMRARSFAHTGSCVGHFDHRDGALAPAGDAQLIAG